MRSVWGKIRNRRGVRALRRLSSRAPRWLAVVAVVSILAVAVAVATIDLPAFFSPVGDTSESLLRNLVTAFVLAVLAYLWFYFWTGHRATRNLIKISRDSPELLFPYAPDIGSAEHVFGRRRLIADVAVDLHQSEGVGPQIVAGHSGTGKTTFLLALAAHLADEHSVLPIVLSLRDSDNDLESADFSELAINRFRQLIDPYTKTESEVDKLWRWMCSRRRVVVLADDLDRNPAAAADPYKTRIRLALDAARRRDLPLVLTTRPAGLPPDLREPVIDLNAQPLDDDAPGDEARPSTAYVLRRAGRPEDDEEARRLVEANVDGGGLLDNAYYLSLLARVLRAGMLTPPPGGDKYAARLALLDAERGRLCGDSTLPSSEREWRDSALREVEDLAVAWLSPRRKSGFEDRWLDAVRHGERFGLLSLDGWGRPQFGHEVLHAYYASRAIARGDLGWITALHERPSSPRVQLALVLAAAGRRDERFCRRAVQKLLDDSGVSTADQKLLRAVGAAEIARAGAFSKCDREIVERCTEARAAAGTVAKHAALEQIARLGGEAAIEALWAYAEDDDYDTRWRAVDWLVRRCSADRGDAEVESMRAPFGAAAYDVLDPMIKDDLSWAARLLDEEKRPDDWEPPIPRLKKMAWLLPALRTGATGSLRSRLERRLETLIDLETRGITPQRGLEASLAQGFKIDARLNQTVPPDRDVQEMLGKVTFWYSQLNLVHALALRMAYDKDFNADSLKRIVAGIGNGLHDLELHPLLRSAARLCRKGLRGSAGEKRARRLERFVWEDEGVVVSGRPAGLDRRAARLVGEITVLLNLNETGDAGQRERFGEALTVPHCVGKSHRRRELRKGCVERCQFGYCPFQPALDRISAHREISRAFCSDQRLRATWLSTFRSSSGASRGGLREFWRWMEAQARF
jgi:hypothetical protein